ncbi:MAG: glycosyltransferase family 25 protein [Pseudomonadales bacterium]
MRMISYVITIFNGPHKEYSEKCADRLFDSAVKHGLNDLIAFEPYKATTPAMLGPSDYDKWHYPDQGVTRKHESGMEFTGYNGKLETRIACFKSHMHLWEKAVASNQPIMILEHDAVFVRWMRPSAVLEQLEPGDVLMLNDPRGATRRGNQYHENIISHNFGIYPIDGVNTDDENCPDGLAGNSAYIITPAAAEKALRLVDQYGYMPNDALLCKQWFGKNLKSIYPYVTRVEQTTSTTSG